MEERDYYAWISTVKNMHYSKLKKLLMKLGSIKELYHADATGLKSMDGLTDQDIAYIIQSKSEFNAKKFYKELLRKKISFTAVCDREFPKKLKVFEHCPYYLFYKGKLPDETKKSVAIVGARACSNYGRNMAKTIARDLSRNGIQIISGMARGIDTYSQLGALDGGEKTFAILGCGVDVVYPIENIELYEEIEAHGGIISEYPPGSRPLQWHFPQRNRIISGLADIIAVIEAKEKSGSLITVEWALEQGKDIFALPGRVDEALSAGCNRLLKVGAGVLTSGKDILQELEIEGNESIKKIEFKENSLEKDFSLVYSELSLNPIGITELIEKTGIQYERISDILLQLQLQGFVEQSVDNYYTKATI